VYKNGSNVIPNFIPIQVQVSNSTPSNMVTISEFLALQDETETQTS
jgi:hypothetical protein